MKKVALFAFNGDPVCFVHVLLNALDMDEKGMEVRLIIEGSAVTMVETLSDPEAPLHSLYEKVKERNLIDCVCKACGMKFGVADSAEAQGLPLKGDMSGHPAMTQYLDQGCEIITF
jgi:hypothetical protein